MVESPAREPNTTLRLPPEPPLSGYDLVDALPGAQFLQPVVVKAPPGETNRLFVVERTGRIMVVTNLAAPTQTLFLDLRPTTVASGVEPGLLGLAFHPGYATNGWFYVFRNLLDSTPSGAGLHYRLSRFTVSPSNPHAALPGSEVILISQFQSNDEHNAGEIQFGPDGYLYLSLGDEGDGVSSFGWAIRPIDGDFFGSILRLDVDHRPGSLPPNPHPAASTNYAIPPDNPFIGATMHGGQPVNAEEVRTEFFAIGFRNPWRMNFDPVTGLLYAGDVGAGAREEVNVVEAGQNYGWPAREGRFWRGQFVTNPPTNISFTDPLYDYRHSNGTNDGRAIIGGLVYRGAAIPDLAGSYIFADNFLGHIWSLRHTGTTVTQLRWIASDLGVSAFGTDPRDGELLVVNFNNGRIRKLLFTPPDTVPNPLPPTLADVGAFADLTTLTPEPGIVPYDINVPFWSDNALKRRWFSVPDTNDVIGFRAEGPWEFPRGTVWIKHFDLEMTNGVPESAVRLETRFVVQSSNGVYGLTYIWDSATNATLAPPEGAFKTYTIRDGATTRSQTWRFPARGECVWCHQTQAGAALGFSTAQLNRLIETPQGPTNRLAQWSAEGYFDQPVTNPAPLRVVAKADDESFPIHYRARSYLHANCSSCHHPNTENYAYLGVTYDARVETPSFAARFDRVITRWGRRIEPGNPEESAIYRRMTTPGLYRMPPIATEVMDEANNAMMYEFIRTLPTLPWTNQNLGPFLMEGGSAVVDGTFRVSSSARSASATVDALNYLNQPAQDNVLLTVRVADQWAASPAARAGLMFRTIATSNAPMVWVAAHPDGQATLRWRTATGAAAQETSVAAGGVNPWLRLRRQGSEVSAAVSPDGLNWTAVGNATVAFPLALRAGLAVSAGETNQFNEATFADLSLTQIRWLQPSSNQVWTAGSAVPLAATVTTFGRPIERVDFVANGVVIGSASSAPYGILWQNELTGAYTVTAVAVDATGSEVATPPLTLQFTLPVSRAVWAGEDNSTRGDWRGVVGQTGYALPRNGTNLPPFAQFGVLPGDSVLWSDTTTSPAAPEAVDGSGRIASAWQAAGSLTVQVALHDAQLRRLRLYFLDWDSLDQRSLSITARDAATGRVLDERVVSGFSSGRHLVWDVRGGVEFIIASQDSLSAVLSGVFLDPVFNEPPEVALLWPTNGASVSLAPALEVWADASDPEGAVESVEFFVDGVSLGQATHPPYAVIWRPMLAGVRTFTVRATDQHGQTSEAEAVVVDIPRAPAAVRVLGEDWHSIGNWKGIYGSEGYSIPSHAHATPHYVRVTPIGVREFVFQSTSSDPRALQRVDNNNRTMTTYVETGGFSFGFDYLDSEWHRLGLYFCDYNDGRRSHRLEVLDGANTNIVLQTLDIRDFTPGFHLTLGVRGPLLLRFIRVGGVNALLTAFFHDPYPAGYEVWRRWTFNVAQLADPAISGPTADADGDGLDNYFEFATGTDALTATPPEARPMAWIEGDRLYYRYTRRLSAEVTITPEVSETLLEWFSGPAVLEVVEESIAGDLVTIVVRSVAPVSERQHQFLRLRIMP